MSFRLADGHMVSLEQIMPHLRIIYTICLHLSSESELQTANNCVNVFFSQVNTSTWTQTLWNKFLYIKCLGIWDVSVRLSISHEVRVSLRLLSQFKRKFESKWNSLSLQFCSPLLLLYTPLAQIRVDRVCLRTICTIWGNNWWLCECSW